MVDISTWINTFLKALQKTFGDRVWFVGLQGSYSRGEATETSDIDMVVILDELSAKDVEAYNRMLNTLSHRELICGFLSGKDELLKWEPADLFQFYYDTKPIQGSLDELLPLLDVTAIVRAIKISVCNIYHGCVHNMLHEKSLDILKALYKSACFVIQAIYYKQSGEYISLQKELISKTNDSDKLILEKYLNLKNGGSVNFEFLSESLFNWSKNIITN